MINIFDKTELESILKKLTPDKKAVWGKMGPQHMVEHLAMVMKVSSGKNPVKLYNTAEVAEQTKQKVVYSEMELTPGIKNPILGDEPPALRHSNLENAMTELKTEINYFVEYYKQNPNATQMQPRMGLLNNTEWIALHTKHFTHHFKQFELL